MPLIPIAPTLGRFSCWINFFEVSFRRPCWEWEVGSYRRRGRASKGGNKNKLRITCSGQCYQRPFGEPEACPVPRLQAHSSSLRLSGWEFSHCTYCLHFSCWDWHEWIYQHPSGNRVLISFTDSVSMPLVPKRSATPYLLMWRIWRQLMQRRWRNY